MSLTIDIQKLIASGDNPVTVLRQQLGMSVQRIAETVGYATNVISFTELGIVHRIPLKLHNYFNIRFSNYNHEFTNKLYDTWILNSRTIFKNKGGLPGPMTTDLVVKLYPLHPFRTYLNYNGFTVTGFCIDVKAPKNQVYLYMGGKQETMPGHLYAALMQSGMPQNYLDELDRQGTAHYRYMLDARINERRGTDGGGLRRTG